MFFPGTEDTFQIKDKSLQATEEKLQHNQYKQYHTGPDSLRVCIRKNGQKHLFMQWLMTTLIRGCSAGCNRHTTKPRTHLCAFGLRNTKLTRFLTENATYWAERMQINFSAGALWFTRTETDWLQHTGYTQENNWPGCRHKHSDSKPLVMSLLLVG